MKSRGERLSFWQLFRKQKVGFYSFLVFSLIFILSLFSEFITNNQPLVIKYKDTYYFPNFETVREIDVGGVYLSPVNINDPYINEIIEEDGWMIRPPFGYSYDTIDYFDTSPSPAAPSYDNFLGTDDQGRDIFARLLYGFRISVLFGLVLTIVSSVIGIFFGAIQGYFGGKVDIILQRFIEVWSGLPALYILIILSSVIVPNFWWLLGILLLFSWLSLVGVVRAEFLKARNYEFVKAAKALGVSEFRIITRHVLPNAFVASLTFMPFILNGSITTLTSLDFLGLGLPPGSPSLGEMLAQAKNNLHAWWISSSVFITLTFMLTLLVLIGDSVRNALDPRN